MRKHAVARFREFQHRDPLTSLDLGNERVPAVRLPPKVLPGHPQPFALQPHFCPEVSQRRNGGVRRICVLPFDAQTALPSRWTVELVQVQCLLTVRTDCHPCTTKSQRVTPPRAGKARDLPHARPPRRCWTSGGVATSFRGADRMHDFIRCALVWVRAVLALRPPGRHRAVPNLPASYPTPSRPVAGAVDFPAAGPGPVPPRLHTDSPTLEPRTVPLPLDSEPAAPVRPNGVADERRRRQRSKSVPRVELICPPHGMVVIR